MEEERDRLYKVDSLEVLDYVKQSVEILMNMKGDEIDTYSKNKQVMDRLKRKEEEKRQLQLKLDKENLLKQVGKLRDNSQGAAKDHNKEQTHGQGRNTNRFILDTSLYSTTSLANMHPQG